MPSIVNQLFIVFVKIVKNNNNGFTLVELLVVIAIITLLGVIVLVAIGNARTQARIVRVQEEMTEIRKMADLVHADSNAYSYVALCTGGPDNLLNTGHIIYGSQLSALAVDVDTQNLDAGGQPTCFADASNFCVSAKLATGGDICISIAGQVGDDVCADQNTICAP